MPTRKQNPEDKRFKQGAFASSVEYERGILGNLVAARCHQLTDAQEITVIWWLQQVSWRDGGMEAFAESLLSEFHSQVGTATMLRLGNKPGQIYTADQVKAVRKEIGCPHIARRFAIRGEEVADADSSLIDYLVLDDPVKLKARQREALARSNALPLAYPAEDFFKACVLHVSELADALKKALVDPASQSLRKGFWNFPNLFPVLETIRQREVKDARESIVETAVTRQVYDELDFALESRSFVLIEGREGIGKSEAARAWCAQHSGQALYVCLEAGVDETTMYRSVARVIGTACSYHRKAVEMRARIQDTLQPGYLMLVLDEAHFLWPQSGRSERAVPKRVDWLRTALVDAGVPVAMVSTPQFFERQCERFRNAGWNANQVQRRLARTWVLPEALSAEDALAVAQSYFPEATVSQAKRIAGVALLTVGYLTSIEHLRKRVDFLAKRRPNEIEQVLVKAALDEYLTKIDKPVSHDRPAVEIHVEASKTVAPSLQGPRTTCAALPFPAETSPLNRASSPVLIPS